MEYKYEIVMSGGIRIKEVGPGKENNFGRLYDNLRNAARAVVGRMSQEGLRFDQVKISPEIEKMAGFNDIYYGELGKYVAAKLGLKEQGEPSKESLEIMVK